MDSTRPIVLTGDEAELLLRMIEINVEGLLDAKEATIEDHTVQSADDLNDLMSGYDDDLVTCQSLKEKVVQCQQIPVVNLRTIALLSVCTYIAVRLTRACYNRLRQ